MKFNQNTIHHCFQIFETYHENTYNHKKLIAKLATFSRAKEFMRINHNKQYSFLYGPIKEISDVTSEWCDKDYIMPIEEEVG